MRIRVFTILGLCVLRVSAQDDRIVAQNAAEVRRKFEIRYVAADAVYINGGREAGLAEGYRLTIRRLKPGDAEMSAIDVAEITVMSVASNSAACEIKSKRMPI